MDDPNPESENPAPSRAPLPDAWWELPLLTRRIIAAGVVILLFAFAGWAGSSIFGGGSDEPNPVVFVAQLPNARVAQWDQLAQCESETRWDLDSGNGYFGGLQFSMTSWQEVDGAGSPALATREEQIMRAEFLFEKQGWGAWPNCSSQLGFQ